MKEFNLVLGVVTIFVAFLALYFVCLPWLMSSGNWLLLIAGIFASLIPAGIAGTFIYHFLNKDKK